MSVPPVEAEIDREAVPRSEARRVWRRDFLLLWSGQSVSMLGSKVTLLALPAVAVLRLDASTLAVGLLGAFEMLGYPLFGLVSGVLVDRLPHRSVMIVCDVGATVVLGLVPLAAWGGFLSMGLLYLVAALSGISRVFFNVAYQSAVPNLVEDRDLVDANAKLSFSSSASELVGPSVAGFILELVRPAIAVLADAGSFAFSALTLAAMRRRPRERDAAEPPAGSGRTVGGVYRDVRSGLSLVLRDTRLRSLVLASATLNFSYEAAFSVLFVFAYRRLGLSTGTVGFDFALGGLGSVLGSALATRVHTLLGFGRALVVSLAAMALSNFLIPAAVLGFAPVLLGGALFIFGFFLVTFNVGQLTLRQRLTPKELLGRTNATFVTLLWSAVPIAFVLGGALGSRIGLVPTLIAAAGLSCTAPLWLSSPLRGLRDLESATQP